MRAWVSVCALLVVALVAALTVASVIIAVQAAADLHQMIMNAHQGISDDVIAICDPFDPSSCF
jgi:hypothetical protein